MHARLERMVGVEKRHTIVPFERETSGQKAPDLLVRVLGRRTTQKLGRLGVLVELVVVKGIAVNPHRAFKVRIGQHVLGRGDHLNLARADPQAD